LPKEKAKPSSKLTEIEEVASGSVGWKVYIRYFQSIGILMSISAVLSNAFNSGAGIYSSSKKNYYFF
jgi:hypothetical protein